METKSDRDRKKISDIDSIPFNILQEEDFFILIHKFKPSWIVTNEVGKEIAVRYFLKDSSIKIAKFLKQHFSPSNGLEKDIEEFIKTLKNVGFGEENHLAEQKDQDDNFKGILFLVTQACNLSCHHCSIESVPTVSNAISKDIFYKIVDEAVSAGASNLLISGGEPLVRKDIFDLIEYAAQYQKVSLLTNGTLIGKKEAEQLKKTGISEIVLSLDGALPETHDKLRGKGNFENVLRGIDLLRKEGLVEKINLNYCLSKYNIGEANDFLEFVRTLGVSKITFLPIKKVGRASGTWEDLRPNRDDYEKFLFKLYDSYFQPDFSLKVNFPLSGFHPIIKPGERVSTCPFGSQLIVNGEGDIYTCPALFIPDFHLGNVFKTSIKDALNSSKLKDLKEKYRLRIEKIDKCQKCSWRSFCLGGCTSAVYLEEGTFWETDDLCELRDRLYRKAILTAVKNKNLGRNIAHAGNCS